MINFLTKVCTLNHEETENMNRLTSKKIKPLNKLKSRTKIASLVNSSEHLENEYVPKIEEEIILPNSCYHVTKTKQGHYKKDLTYIWNL